MSLSCIWGELGKDGSDSGSLEVRRDFPKCYASTFSSRSYHDQRLIGGSYLTQWL